MRELTKNDFDDLLRYLHQLSDASKNRFGPHAYNPVALAEFYSSGDTNGFIALHTGNIIGYSILKIGMLLHDAERLNAYSYPRLNECCGTYAPSIADFWQDKGIGKLMFHYLLSFCKSKQIERIILWGGVQCSNEKALCFYERLGFKTLGYFEYNGMNQDMILEI